MDVLVIGGGGREHALIWKISQSPLVDEIYVAPGNPGIAELATRVDISIKDIGALIAFAREKGVGLTVVGPEDPLGAGIVDAFAQAGLVIFGPNQIEAQLELSKVFCKQLLWNHGIPTADGDICSSAEEADTAIDRRALPIVVKPDGGTEGKGVRICQTREEAKAHVRKIMVEHAYEKTGDTGEQVIIEDCLVGREASITVLTDGTFYVELPTSEDHKQGYDGDEGPMSGGMGAYSPSAIAEERAETIRTDIVEPLVVACPNFRGVLYIALMITEDGPKVLEINVRFGDPEVQVVLPRIKTDLVPILLQIAQGELTTTEIEVDSHPCVCVVSVSGCYPESGYPDGEVISGIEAAQALEGVTVFQAGTRTDGDDLVTNSGRVLNVSAVGKDMPEAIRLAYSGTKAISFESQRFRTDIGQRPGD